MCKIMEDMKNEAAHKAEREKAIKLWTRASLPKR